MLTLCVQDQWQRKKQTKEQAKAAKRAKLDPQNAKSAKDVLDQNALKRKRDEEHAGPEPKTTPAPAKEEKEKPAKKQRLDDGDPLGSGVKKPVANAPTIQQVKAEQSQSKKERKQKPNTTKEEKTKLKAEQRKRDVGKAKEITRASGDADASNANVEGKEVTGHFQGLDAAATDKAETAATIAESLASSASPVFDAPATKSGTSSISSFPDPSSIATEKLDKPVTEPKPSQEELRLRLQRRLEELRTARRANKEDSGPARSRQELIEERRKKDEERKVRKKALRKQQKEEERLKKEEEIARGSPLMSPAIRSPCGGGGGPSSGSERAHNLAFGQVLFENGQTMTADLGKLLDPTKKRGPRDAKRMLEAAQAREEKLAAMEPEKRADIAEKDMWLTARKRAHGERVKDDTSLLKKALKRKEKQKKRSEKAWDARLEGVRKSQESRQHRREDNIQKRKDDKASKGAKKAGKKGKPKKARPGFEGSFRAGGKGQ